MKNLISLAFLFLCINLNAQEDTTVVQTLNLESTTRNGVFSFPDDPNKSYRKILMEYTMRCLNADINPGDNSTGCHEWDYSCNTFITDSTTVDSASALHPNYLISNFGEDEFSYTTQAVYDKYQHVQKEVIYNEVIAESFLTVGSGNESLSHPFSTATFSAKVQYLWKAEELTGSVLTAGELSSVRFYIEEEFQGVDFLKISLKQTEIEELDENNIQTDGFTEVYNLNSTLKVGANTFRFHEPFLWDGTSNLIMEISYNNSSSSLNASVKGDFQDFKCAMIGNSNDQYLLFNGAESIELNPEAMPEISEEITVMFWSFGNEDVLPVNTSIFEAVDANNNRQANVHLPWSNGRIYWDCGNNGNGYDRIDKAANLADFSGKWNHWAFTKNANSGMMQIFLNGQLFHTGSGKNKSIDISKFYIGSSHLKTNNYFGGLNEFSVWNKALNINTIQAYLYKNIDTDHPDYENLMAYYRMDGITNGVLQDSSPKTEGTNIDAALQMRNIKGEDIYRNFYAAEDRPVVDFVQGQYDQTINDVIVTENVLRPQHAVRSFSVEGTDLIEGPTIYVWQATDAITYDQNGMMVSTETVNPENTINIEDLSYYNKFPSKYELLSFVTPYGFSLDLGPEGKTWTFDVTDFKPILKGDRRLSMERGGQFNEEFDIKFLFIEGTPDREVLSIQNIWPFASGGYGAITDDRVFENRELLMNPNGAEFKIRSSITGHGQNGEFIPRLHYINIDEGDPEFLWEVWKECGANPVYPQGGTWIFDRAGWCPGMPSDLGENYITPFVTPGQTANIDYGVISTADQSATNYLVSNQLVTYGPINHSIDAEILNIVRPSLDVVYSRLNPACIDPIIQIKNLGSENLTSLSIEYSIQGGSSLFYEWNGDLAFHESEEVTLPTNDLLFWQNAGSNVFEVKLSQPNGQVDQNSSNDSMTSTFKKSDNWPISDMTFSYKTNNRASQNQLIVKDQSGAVVFERSAMQNNTLYNDLITLGPGCYTMDFTDSGNDGLDFWFWAAQGQDVGTGYFQIHINGIPFKTFEPDFGSDIHYNFFVDEVVTTRNPIKNTLMSVYPNPTNDDASLELIGYEGMDIEMILTDVTAKQLSRTELQVVEEHVTIPIDLSQLPSGVYFIKTLFEGKVNTSKIVKQ